MIPSKCVENGTLYHDENTFNSLFDLWSTRVSWLPHLPDAITLRPDLAGKSGEQSLLALPLGEVLEQAIAPPDFELSASSPSFAAPFLFTLHPVAAWPPSSAPTHPRGAMYVLLNTVSNSKQLPISWDDAPIPGERNDVP